MKVSLSRLLPLLTGIVGAAVLFAGIACGGGGKAQTATTATATATATNTPSPSETPSATPTATKTNTPTPSPTPYNGAVLKFSIPRFGIAAPVEELGLTPDGALDTPTRQNTDVGFYPMYDKPGRVNPDNTGWLTFGKQQTMPTKGNSVTSAHVYYNNIPGPFKNLWYQPAIAVGDEVTVTMEDGRQYRYRVIDKARYDKDTIPMGDIIWPSQKPADKEWLTMITCGGQLDATGQNYVDRIVVVAERVDDASGGTPQT